VPLDMEARFMQRRMGTAEERQFSANCFRPIGKVCCVEDPTPDSAAIAASLASPAEFAPIFHRHFDAVHAYLQRRVGRDAADEIAAQTFLVAFERRARYDCSRPDARPWLFGIATNLLLHHRRRAVRQLRAYARTGVDPVLDAFEGVEARLDAAGLGRQLAAALAELPAEELEVLLLYAWADLSYPEISRALEIPLGTVRSRLWRTRGRIRELLEADRASSCAPPI
jgi:RNA polymerase sigma-70 factor, ECF subfamily